MHWRLVVLNPDGTAKATVDASDEVVSLDSFDVTPAGDCGEATLTVLGSGVSLGARDIVTLETSPDGSAWEPRYRGMVVLAASGLSVEPQSVKLVGLRQRFFELTVTDPLVDGDDIAEMAFGVLDGLTLPSGVTIDAADFPLTAFELGDRFPQLESVGELLDALAETAPRFVVPSGESYTYDGVTYNEGDVVPPVEWGVKADGSAFFGRALASSDNVDEATAGVRIEWGQVEAERVANQARLIYVNGVDTQRLERYAAADASDAVGLNREPAAWLPLNEVAIAAPTTAEASEVQRVLEGPLDFMTPITVTVEGSTGFTNTANAVDGDPDTFATGSATPPQKELVLRATPPAGFSAPHCLWLVRVAGVRDDVVRKHAVAKFLGTYSNFLRYRLSDSALSEPVTHAFAQLIHVRSDVSEFSGVVELLLDFGQNTEVRVHSVECFVPDVLEAGSASVTLARALLREPEQEVADVTLYDLEPVRTELVITPADSSAALAIPVERVEYRITTDEGVTTTYHAGQKFDGELESQRVVLERLAQRAAADRERSRA